MKAKVLFLYTEIAEYFLAGVQALSDKGLEIHIVNRPVNKEAPFEFRQLEHVKFYKRGDYTDKELLSLAVQIMPDIIICSGWTDKAYLKTASSFKKKIPVVLSLDNHWSGSLKQCLARVLSPFFLKTRFSHIWVPGKPQKEYARKLGFPEKVIYTGFYSADTKLFSDYYISFKDLKEQVFPKKIICVGRYIEQKNLNNLWNAFIEFQNEKQNDWELICVGTGEQFDQRVEHPKIKHMGFVQPGDMGDLIKSSGVFVLPSKFEPWGVVVHEYAAAGYPLLCSKQTGAASEFLEEGKNGYLFDAFDKESIKEALRKITSLSDKDLINMGKHSVELSEKLSPVTWAETVLKILKSSK